MDGKKLIGGTLAAAGMVNMVMHKDDEPHTHLEEPAPNPPQLTRTGSVVTSAALTFVPKLL